MNLDSAKIRAGGSIYRDTQHVIAVSENRVLTYSSHAPNPHFLEAWTRIVELVGERFEAGLLALTIIDRDAHAPDDVSRAHIRDTVTRNAAKIKAFAYVVEGEGFVAAAVRSALALISLAARYPFPLKVFGRVEGAVPWLLNRPGEDGGRASAAKLVDLANSLRGELPSGTNAV